MEKLLKLLQQYYSGGFNPGWEMLFDFISYNRQSKQNSELLLISKEYGFIQRLCENDKIDYNKCNYAEIVYKDGKEADLESYEHILMELAIQELPVLYLCKILK